MSDSFKEALPEEFRNDPSLKDINDVAALTKSYISAQRMLGSSVRIPSSDASDEARKEFYNRLTGVPGVVRLPDDTDPESFGNFYSKLGRPASADGYELDIPVAADPIAKEFTRVAFDVGLTKNQATKLTQWNLEMASRQQQVFEAQRTDAQKTLKDRWGADYDNRFKGAQAARDYLIDEYGDAMRNLVNGPAGNNPAFIDVLSQFGEKLKESGTINTLNSVTYGMSASEAKDRLEEILNNRQHAYWKGNDPGHDEAVKKVGHLTAIVYPD